MADAKELLEALLSIKDFCVDQGFDDHAQLELFEIGWLITAGNIRNMAIDTPGGFQKEQERQLNLLAKMVALVNDETPDPEMERLVRAGDVQGIVERLDRIRRGGGTH
jgi:hypothetical protein